MEQNRRALWVKRSARSRGQRILYDKGLEWKPWSRIRDSRWRWRGWTSDIDAGLNDFEFVISFITHSSTWKWRKMLWNHPVPCRHGFKPRTVCICSIYSTCGFEISLSRIDVFDDIWHRQWRSGACMTKMDEAETVIYALSLISWYFWILQWKASWQAAPLVLYKARKYIIWHDHREVHFFWWNLRLDQIYDLYLVSRNHDMFDPSPAICTHLSNYSS